MYNSIKWYVVISIFVDLTVEPCTVLFQIKLAAEETTDVELLSPRCMPMPPAFTVHPSPLRSPIISSSTLESYRQNHRSLKSIRLAGQRLQSDFRTARSVSFPACVFLKSLA